MHHRLFGVELVNQRLDRPLFLVGWPREQRIHRFREPQHRLLLALPVSREEVLDGHPRARKEALERRIVGPDFGGIAHRKSFPKRPNRAVSNRYDIVAPDQPILYA
ncbi:hypothetical protein D3C71_1773030 [compost metagenome]